MTKAQAFEYIYELIKAEQALDMAQNLIHWDAATTGVPEKSLHTRGQASGWLSGESFRRFVSPDTLEAIETLEAHDSELNKYELAMVREFGRKYRKQKSIPPEEYQAYSALVTEAETVWETAREKRDFEMILPYYEKIFDYQRRLCDWYGYKEHPYDALLDDYEIGADVKMLDNFFGELRKKIVPLLNEIKKSNKHPKEVTGHFDIAKQRELLPWLADLVGYDRKRGKVGEVEHPFCTTINRHDVRITTKYHEDNLMAALYSTIHEAGHAIYEQNIGEDLVQFGLDDDASMGIHESQSRLYENMIGRSRAFTSLLLPKLRSLFDFDGWNEEMMYQAVNVVRPSLIRIEADELTYSLHVMVRYDLEKALITGDIKASDLPRLWDEKYEEFLGIRPGNLAEGVLQDVHWSLGLFGYFPSYAVGSAYGAQLIHAIKKSIDIDAAIKNEDLSPVTGWLKENIHQYGVTKKPNELLQQATGELFNPKYFVDYLSEKFSELYLSN